MEDKHITEKELITYHNRGFCPQDEAALLSHVASCPKCSELFSKSFLLIQPAKTAPRNLKEGVFLGIGHLERKRRQTLLSYNLKVCVAVAGILLCMVPTMFFNFSLLPESSQIVKDHFPYTQTESISHTGNKRQDNAETDLTFVVHQYLNKLNTSLRNILPAGETGKDTQKREERSQSDDKTEK